MKQHVALDGFETIFRPLLETLNEAEKTMEYWKIACTFGAVSSGIAVFVFSTQSVVSYLLLVGAAFVFPFFAIWLWLAYRTEMVRQKRDALVAEVLLTCSAFPRGTDARTVLSFCAKPHFGVLGIEFQRTLNEMKAGASFEGALRSMEKRCASTSISRMVDLLILGYESGADLSHIFREAATDAFETQFVLKERAAGLVVEKYTILAGGGILVPLILGLVTQLMTGFDFGGLDALELGLSSEKRSALLKAALQGMQLYLVEYAILAAFFVGVQEGHWKKGIRYAVFLLPLSWLAWNWALTS